MKRLLVLVHFLVVGCGGPLPGLCPPGAACSTDTAPQGASATGGTCADSTECRNALICDTSIGGGYCTAVCNVDRPCEAGAVCVDFGDISLCMDQCANPGDDSYCRSGQDCRVLTNRSFGFCL